ncbi:MAG: hypothetical protein DI598_04200, partial [Pseudopedobacter saltans]
MKSKLVLTGLALMMLFSNLYAQKKGWVNLSNGAISDNWHTYGHDNVTTAWTDKNGVISLEGANDENKATRQGGDLVSNQSYENFEL